VNFANGLGNSHQITLSLSWEGPRSKYVSFYIIESSIPWLGFKLYYASVDIIDIMYQGKYLCTSVVGWDKSLGKIK
jgi:hypothetical protein